MFLRKNISFLIMLIFYSNIIAYTVKDICDSFNFDTQNFDYQKTYDSILRSKTKIIRTIKTFKKIEAEYLETLESSGPNATSITTIEKKYRKIETELVKLIQCLLLNLQDKTIYIQKIVNSVSKIGSHIEIKKFLPKKTDLLFSLIAMQTKILFENDIFSSIKNLYEQHEIINLKNALNDFIEISIALLESKEHQAQETALFSAYDLSNFIILEKTIAHATEAYNYCSKTQKIEPKKHVYFQKLNELIGFFEKLKKQYLDIKKNGSWPECLDEFSITMPPLTADINEQDYYPIENFIHYNYVIHKWLIHNKTRYNFIPPRVVLQRLNKKYSGILEILEKKDICDDVKKFIAQKIYLIVVALKNLYTNIYFTESLEFEKTGFAIQSFMSNIDVKTYPTQKITAIGNIMKNRADEIEKIWMARTPYYTRYLVGSFFLGSSESLINNYLQELNAILNAIQSIPALLEQELPFILKELNFIKKEFGRYKKAWNNYIANLKKQKHDNSLDVALAKLESKDFLKKIDLIQKQLEKKLQIYFY